MMKFLLWIAFSFGVSSNANVYTCDQKENANLPFCDPSKSIEDRTADLLDRIPVSDIPGLLDTNSNGSKKLHLDPYQWWGEALHGIAGSPAVSFKDPTPFATSFPQIIGLSSSFNNQLFHEMAQAISTEARAFYNQRHAGLTFWSPNINIYRDPRWGRGQETPGEDPFLNSEYAAMFVTGLQESKNNQKYLKVSSCCKHFSAYSQENPRLSVDSIVNQRDLADTYYPAFKSCVQRGHASSLMCSYNAVNGIPSCADHHLLTKLVRKTWKFDGYIVSDCGAVNTVINYHHYTQNPSTTCKTVLRAGMDINCGSYFRNNLKKAVDKEVVTPKMLRKALSHLLRVQMRLGLFNKQKDQPFSNISVKQIDDKKHRILALKAARQSIVLLKNTNYTLPFRSKSIMSQSQSKFALIGPHFNASHALLGNYNGVPSFISTPFDGIKRVLGEKNIQTTKGCDISSKNRSEIQTAVDLASKADYVLLFIGLNQKEEAESHDRTHISLPGVQYELVERVARAAKTAVTVVVLSGGSLDLSSLENNPKVGAILYAGYPGQSGGDAVADVLFGLYNPSGRLTHTFYPSNFSDDVSIYDMNMRPTEATGNPGRTYRFYTGTPVYPFGHGLSYTSFKYMWDQQESTAVFSMDSLQASLDGDDISHALKLNIQVRNIGSLSSDHSVLAFAVPPHAGRHGRPLKSLVAYTRISNLKPTGTQDVILRIPVKAFALANRRGDFRIKKGFWTVKVGDLQLSVYIYKRKGVAEDSIFTLYDKS